MRKILITGALVAGLTCLAGCSDSDVDEEELEEIITAALLNGTWAKCENEAPTSFGVEITFADGSAAIEVTRYSDLDCATVSMMEPDESFDYTFGSAFTLDGTVDGITNGVILDTTNYLAGGVSQPDTFGAMAIKDDLITLYLTDETADPAKDATSADKRPTTLDPIPFIKQ